VSEPKVAPISREAALALIEDANRWQAAHNKARDEVARARHLAKHLFQMIPPDAWRETGGDDGQGHYEGDYRAEQLADEIRSWDEADRG
jgi:hypothetical protein